MSTTSSQDLSGFDGQHFILERIAPEYEGDGVGSLEYPNRWFVAGRFGGCSCHFRNFLRENPPEFWAPEEWFGEDPEDIEATTVFYDFVTSLVTEGYQVDTVTVSDGDGPFDTIRSREVSLSEVSREAFRFMDLQRFKYVP